MTGIRPSWLYYPLAAVLLAAGIGILVRGAYSFVRSVAGPRTRIVVPGSGEVTFDRAGEYTVSYEHRSVVGGRTFNTPTDMPPLTCTLVEASSGREIHLTPVAGSFTYAVGHTAGVAVYNARIDSPGTYRLSASYPPGGTGPENVVLAVGDPFSVGTFGGFFMSIPLCFLFSAGAIALFVVTLVRRILCKKRLAQPPGATSSMPPPPPR